MNMTIKVRKSLRQVAIDLANRMLEDNSFSARKNFPKVLEDGYVAFVPYVTDAFGRHLWHQWDNFVEPFGHEAWSNLWKKFARWVETDEHSVHHGASLPDGGVAVLDTGSFAVICKQMIDDNGWWDWHWHPVAVVADPS